MTDGIVIAEQLEQAVRGDVVRIRWRDSSRISMGWLDLDEYAEHLDKLMQGLEETTGYFVARNAAYVLILLNLSYRTDDKPSGTDGMAIPHEAIRSFEIIVRGEQLDRHVGA